MTALIQHTVTTFQVPALGEVVSGAALGLSLATASNKSSSVWAERAAADYHNDDRVEGGDVMLCIR